jgi:hypothetical protein
MNNFFSNFFPSTTLILRKCVQMMSSAQVNEFSTEKFKIKCSFEPDNQYTSKLRLVYVRPNDVLNSLYVLAFVKSQIIFA